MSENTNTTAQGTAAPSKEEFISYMQEQIEIAEVRNKLQSLHTSIAKGRLEELQALSYIAQITNPSKRDSPTTKHVVTEEDMKNNPELSEYGVKVGDEIDLPTDDGDILEKQPTSSSKERKLKKN
jgi:hypothetical protein